MRCERVLRVEAPFERFVVERLVDRSMADRVDWDGLTTLKALRYRMMPFDAPSEGGVHIASTFRRLPSLYLNVLLKMFLKTGHQLNEIAGFVPIIELVFEDAVPAILHRAR